jgi:hypothetical protein
MSVERTVTVQDRATRRRERGSAFSELAEVKQLVKERPLTAIMVAAAAGFIFNGGMTSRAGRNVTAFVFPIVLRSIITSVIVDFVTAEIRHPASSRRGASK